MTYSELLLSMVVVHNLCVLENDGVNNIAALENWLISPMLDSLPSGHFKRLVEGLLSTNAALFQLAPRPPSTSTALTPSARARATRDHMRALWQICPPGQWDWDAAR